MLNASVATRAAAPPSVLRRLAIGLGGLLYALVFAELFLRLFHPVALMPRYVTGGPHGIRTNMASATFHQRTPEVDVELRINGQGLRADRDFPLAKPADRCRVALLGDSYFMGFEAALEDSFQAQLERELDARGFACEVLNFAVSGFGVGENLIALEKTALNFQPDVVLMSLHRTDPEDDVRAGLYRLEGGRVVRTGAAYLPGIETSDWLMTFPAYRWLIENCHLYSAVREGVAKLVKDALVYARGAQDEESAGKETDADLTRALVLEVDRVTAARNAALYLLEIPTRSSRIAFKPTGILDGFERQTLDGRVVTLLDRFHAAAHRDIKLYWEQGHIHWTPLGNRLAAEAAADVLAKAPGLQAYRRP